MASATTPDAPAPAAAAPAAAAATAPATATVLVHAGHRSIEGAVVPPVFMSSTFESGPPNADAGYSSIRYLRLNNSPNHQQIHAKLAELEGGGAAMVTASGMAAVTVAVLAAARSGDHVLAHNQLYGAAAEFFFGGDAAEFGLAVDAVDATGGNEEAWAARLRPETRLFYVEAITNPLTDVPDLAAVVRFCRRHRLVAVIDATFASPAVLRPLALGFDVVVHSATKYLNGHSDIVAGAIVVAKDVDQRFVSNPPGKTLFERIVHRMNILGPCLPPHSIFLLNRGLVTMQLRVRQQSESALAVAAFLEAHPLVRRVRYPGLPSHPNHRRAAELFAGSGLYGGMLCFDVGRKKSDDGAKDGTDDSAAAVALRDGFLAAVRLAIVAPSLGGPETLLSAPALTSHLLVPREERLRLGIADGTIRMSVGLEAAADIIADLSSALDAALKAV